MARSTVVVTGAGGYIGRHVVSALADLGFEPTAIVRGRGHDIDPRAELITADVLVSGSELAHLADRAIAVIHLAWQDGFVHNAPSHMANLSAHFRFLTALADAGVPRIAALGTMHEVGYWEGSINADTPTNPTSFYGIAKDALRRSTVLAIGDRAEYAWLRAYYILGDDRRNRSIFTKLLEAVDRGEEEFPFTSGANRYDFIDVAELGRQIAVVATTPGVRGVLNVCTGEPVTLADRVEQFIRDNELPIRLRYGAFPDRPYDSPGVWGDATEIKTIMSARRLQDEIR